MFFHRSDVCPLDKLNQATISLDDFGPLDPGTARMVLKMVHHEIWANTKIAPQFLHSLAPPRRRYLDEVLPLKFELGLNEALVVYGQAAGKGGYLRSLQSKSYIIEDPHALLPGFTTDVLPLIKAALFAAGAELSTEEPKLDSWQYNGTLWYDDDGVERVTRLTGYKVLLPCSLSWREAEAKQMNSFVVKRSR